MKKLLILSASCVAGTLLAQQVTDADAAARKARAYELYEAKRLPEAATQFTAGIECSRQLMGCNARGAMLARTRKYLQQVVGYAPQHWNRQDDECPPKGTSTTVDVVDEIRLNDSC